MAKFDALKYHEEKIQNRIETLKSTEIAQYFNNPNLEIEMCEALLNVFNIVKAIEETRWGRAPLNSNKNLSWIVASKINPILSKIKDIGGDAISTYSPVNINEKSKQSNIQNIAIFLQKQLYFEDSEKNALDFLAESLFILIAHYSPAEKKPAKKGDQPYCIYCYRECYIGSDSCDVHAGVNRTKGKRFFKRYLEMRDAINAYEKGRKRQKFKKFNGIFLKKLNDENICAWADAPDQTEWVSQVLSSLDICDKWKVNDKANELLKQSVRDVRDDSPAWPGALYGTVFRYQAYILATTRKPSKQVTKKLNLVWGGEKIINISKRLGNERSGLQRAVIAWRNKINLLRSNEVPDELIKVATGLEFLPIRKSGGAANKNLPEQN